MNHAPLDYDASDIEGERETTPREIGCMIGAAIGGVSAMLMVALVAGLIWGLFLWATEARAHEAAATVAMPLGWSYPFSCCSNQDCKQATDAEVREVVKGYLVTASGEIVPYGDKRIKDSPDGLFHTCQVAGDFKEGRVLCLFVPPRGF